jgi:hypothetical protein
MQRINLGLYAVLGSLHASANWRRIAEEIWPFKQGPPATPIGEAEARWETEKRRMSVAGGKQGLAPNLRPPLPIGTPDGAGDNQARER